MTEIHADELRPGDIVDYHGQRHVICRIDRSDGAAWPVASDGSGWAIALGREPIRVQRTVVSSRSECDGRQSTPVTTVN